MIQYLLIVLLRSLLQDSATRYDTRATFVAQLKSPATKVWCVISFRNTTNAHNKRLISPQPKIFFGMSTLDTVPQMYIKIRHFKIK